MSIAFLNGEFAPVSELKLSPMDRGFMFGDGIYEVIPCYGGKLVGYSLHVQRLQDGLSQLQISPPSQLPELANISEQLLAKNQVADAGIYIQISRGVAPLRNHGFPEGIEPTLFVMLQTLPPLDTANAKFESGLKLALEADKRWRRCQIKSTSLLGNVLHYQGAKQQGLDEVLLYDELGNVTEGSTCNVFCLFGDQIHTAPLEMQLLPGITRHIVLDIARRHTPLAVIESAVPKERLFAADEVWVTSSSKGVYPVVAVDGKAIGDGKVGPWARKLARQYQQHMFDYG